MLNFFRGFFLKEVQGYGTKAPEGAFPFPVFRSRHKATIGLKASNMSSGRDANCSDRKTGPKPSDN